MLTMGLGPGPRPLARLERFGRRLPATSRKGIRRGLLKVRNAIVALVPRRTGRLAEDWEDADVEADKTSTGSTGGLDVDNLGARMIDRGGTIVPKNARLLAVPLRDARSPRDVATRLFTLRAKSGKLYLASRKSGTALDLWFALVERVELTARHYVRRGLRKATSAVRRELAGAIVEDARAGQGGPE